MKPIPPDAPAVEIEHLTKVFRDFWRRVKVRAVDGLSLRVGSGEILGLLGPNGSGKSTTLKILLGLLHPTAGSVRVLGASPRDVRVKRLIGYLPEESYLYHYLTARETLDFYGRLFDLDRAERERRTEQLLDMVGLRAAADRPVGEFSKGMARRLGLAQALLNNPRLVVLDEPTSGLDPIGCRQVKDLVLTLAGQGRTVLLSSHLLADVEDVCHRVAILHGGRLQACGRVADLLAKQDRVRFTVPALPADRLAAIADFVRASTGRPPDMEHPSVSLERFFLDVVERAHASAGAPARATDAMPMAGFLATTGEGTKETTAGPGERS